MEYGLNKSQAAGRIDQLTLIYWGISLVIGVPLLADWLGSWRVPATLAQPWFALFLVVTFAISQIMYVIVARHDGRPLVMSSTLLFAIGNGVCETLAFAAVYRVGAILGDAAAGLIMPSMVGPAGFALGLIFFVIYGGLIHGLFWLPILPPHLDDSPRSIRIRRLRPLAEIGLVLGWSLCFFYGDIWTVIFFHVLVDLGLMLRVRPPIFVR